MENIEQYASCAGFEQYASIPFQMLSGCVMSRSGERSVRIREVKGSNPSRSTIKKAVKSLISRLFCVFGRFQFLPEKCRTVAFAPRIIRIHLTRRKSENSGENRRFSEKRFLRANNAILGETEPFASKRIHQNDSHSLCKNRWSLSAICSKNENKICGSDFYRSHFLFMRRNMWFAVICPGVFATDYHRRQIYVLTQTENAKKLSDIGQNWFQQDTRENLFYSKVSDFQICKAYKFYELMIYEMLCGTVFWSKLRSDGIKLSDFPEPTGYSTELCDWQKDMDWGDLSGYHIFKFQGKYSLNIFLKCCSCSTVYEDE